MGDFDILGQDNLDAMADALDASANNNERAGQKQVQVASDMKAVAAIAKEISKTLTENTDAMRELSAATGGAVTRVEHASEEVYARVEEQAVRTLEGVDRAARAALDNSQRSAEDAVEALERARKATVAATVAVCLVVCLACVIVLLVAIGAMWLQFEAGASWLLQYGWLSIAVAMLACGVLGALIAVKVSERS